METTNVLGTIPFIADFVFQSNYIAQNKSSCSKVLSKHVIIYGLPFIILFGLSYGLINIVLHFIVDYITSRVTKRQWECKEVHNFFVTIGFDQWVHTSLLFITYVTLNSANMLGGLLYAT